MDLQPVESAAAIMKDAIERFNPTHIVSMVSGGKDSAASHHVLIELGYKIDFVIHGKTGCGIKQTTKHVEDYYGASNDLIIADAGTTYEDRVLRKGFYGKGRAAHNYAFRELKATYFRQAVSHNIRHGKRGVRVLLVNGARRDESENRMKNLEVTKCDPASKNNIWVNPIHFWTQEQRDSFLETRQVRINPVAKALCRSGECMCGTMQSKAERWEASVLYPEWGNWMDDLEAEAIRLHGFGWDENKPRPDRALQGDLFLESVMCGSCIKGGKDANHQDI